MFEVTDPAAGAFVSVKTHVPRSVGVFVPPHGRIHRIPQVPFLSHGFLNQRHCSTFTRERDRRLLRARAEWVPYGLIWA